MRGTLHWSSCVGTGFLLALPFAKVQLEQLGFHSAYQRRATDLSQTPLV